MPKASTSKGFSIQTLKPKIGSLTASTIELGSMSKSDNQTGHRSTTTNGAAQAESYNQQAAAKATTESAEEMAPEKIVGDELPPSPDYPPYWVHAGQPITLADLDPDESEDHNKKKHVEKELDRQRDRLQSLQERLYAEHKRSLLIVLQATDTACLSRA